MKICAIFLSVAMYCWANNSESYAQKTDIVLTKGDKTLSELFTEIEDNSEFIFLYNNSIDLSGRITVDDSECTITEILDKVTDGKTVRYEIVDRQIVFYTENRSPEPEITQQSNQKQITGTVVDSSGEAIIGANVMEKGTTNGIISDISGNFSMTVRNNATLQVSYIGYISQEIAVGNQNHLQIILREDLQSLEEVVVIGYGTMRKSDLTGSVAQVQSESLLKAAAPRIDQALNGLLAGVQVISTTGQPGEAINIRIRGVGSISAGNAPLYVVDGYPEADISMLNPNDIETIDILKDASATAIYGSRGSSGVVIITTKRGKEGTARINFDAYYGWQEAQRFPKYLSMQEQAQYYYDGIVNENKDLGYDISSGDHLCLPLS